MKLTKAELKKTIYDFNRISNRLLRANVNDYSIILKKFIKFVETDELIWAFITDAGQPSYDIAEEINEVSGYSNLLFELGDTDQEEVTNIYHILKYCVDNDKDIPRTLAFSYSSSNNFQDKTKGFNDRVVMVLITHIEAYLNKVGIDMGLDENTKYDITINGGQVNLATDNSSITATQNNSSNLLELNKLVNKIYQNIDIKVNDEDLETIKETLEVIKSELNTDIPKKSMIKTAIKGLKAVKGSVELGASIVALIQFVQGII